MPLWDYVTKAATLFKEEYIHNQKVNQITPLQLANLLNEYDVVRALIHNKADVNFYNINKPLFFDFLNTPLLVAIYKNDLELIKILVEEGNADTSFYLNDAISMNSISITKYLLEHNALRDRDNLYLAEETGNLELVKLIFDNTIDYFHPGEVSARNKQYEILEYILQNGIKLHETTLEAAILSDSKIIDIISNYPEDIKRLVEFRSKYLLELSFYYAKNYYESNEQTDPLKAYKILLNTGSIDIHKTDNFIFFNMYETIFVYLNSLTHIDKNIKTDIINQMATYAYKHETNNQIQNYNDALELTKNSKFYYLKEDGKCESNTLVDKFTDNDQEYSLCFCLKSEAICDVEHVIREPEYLEQLKETLPERIYGFKYEYNPHYYLIRNAVYFDAHQKYKNLITPENEYSYTKKLIDVGINLFFSHKIALQWVFYAYGEDFSYEDNIRLYEDFNNLVTYMYEKSGINVTNFNTALEFINKYIDTNDTYRYMLQININNPSPCPNENWFFKYSTSCYITLTTFEENGQEYFLNFYTDNWIKDTSLILTAPLDAENFL